ncbi:MAG: ornithine cyclodeaminase family protein, partial [Gammaproteobacteria bacterium]|nr:ornithine cyclodeaminase family protein [Gammaproteobacteria bacterium]
MRSPIRIIKASEIKQYYSMKQAIDAMEGAFASLSSGESHVPLRFVSKLPTDNLLMLFKPAFVEKDRRVTVKFLTKRFNSSIEDIPVIQGVVMVMDSDTGEILSIMDGEYLTALRTGAGSGLATRYFAREDAQTMAIYGCGAQGRTQLEAVLCERDIKKVLLFDRRKESAEQLIIDMQRRFPIEMVYAENNSYLKEADIICTATNATAPLFLKDDVKSGVHINSVGSFQPDMQELDPLLIKDAKVYSDQTGPVLAESGDFIKPIKDGIFNKDH